MRFPFPRNGCQIHHAAPAYFFSLSLENVRGFEKKQTISFARAAGWPAQWPISLGDNGVGKTTVLKSLATVISPTNLAHEVAKCGTFPALVKRILQARTTRNAAALFTTEYAGMVRANFPHLPIV